MSKKDYILIANAIANSRASAQLSGSVDQVYAVEQTARYVASALASDNARFDRAKFVAACVNKQ